MATVPIRNPTVPFLGRFPRPLRVGSRIKITGTMTNGCENRFVINLQSGPATKPRDDTPLHLSIRPNESTIVRNHYQNNAWGCEERSSHCPISPGKCYDILISVSCNSFSISVNGSHYCDFNYRIRFDKVSYISIEGQTNVSFIDFH